MNNAKHEEIVSLDSEYLMATYGRLDVAPAKGKSATLTDHDGRQWIDFTSGIGVNSLGYCDPDWVSAVTAQLGQVQHFSNYYYSENASYLAKALCEASGMSRVFFGNSGAEANEGAIKVARKYSFDKYGEGRSTIVTLNASFHGRTVTTLAATGQDNFHRFFGPFTDGFVYTPMNDAEALEKALTPNVCAVMAEVIQGEGGVNLMDASFADTLYRLAAERDILVIIDEVQTGIGRTGRPFAFQKFPHQPDIVTLAKGLGGGLPIGAFLVGKKCSDTLGKGTHGSTFGANPVVCAGAREVIRRVFAPDFLREVKEKGQYIRDGILKANAACVREVRGDGMMIGIQIAGEPGAYLKKALDEGLLILTAGKDVLRLLPPLTISREEMDKGISILQKVLKEGV